jgi:pimeloyl-ACP methyl ester carboxylesterase
MQIRHLNLRAVALLLTLPLSAVASSQEPATGYALVNGLKMYYEIHGKGQPVVLLQGSFMTIPGNWTGMIAALSKTRQVIAVEMQGHGRTADIDRDFSYDALSDDIAALLDYLKIGKADIVGYSMGAGVALNMAIRHPDNVRKVVSISGVFRDNGWVQEARDAYPHFTADAFKGSPIEADYQRLSPTPHEFPKFVKRAISMDLKHYDFGASVMRPRSASRLAVLPDTTHVTLMQKIDVIAPMITDFLDSKPTTHPPH